MRTSKVATGKEVIQSKPSQSIIIPMIDMAIQPNARKNDISERETGGGLKETRETIGSSFFPPQCNQYATVVDTSENSQRDIAKSAADWKNTNKPKKLKLPLNEE